MISLQQTDSPVPLVVTVKLIGPMLAERTALMVLPTITWEQVARQQLQTVNGAEYARELLRQRAAHAQPLSYGRG